MYNPLDDNELDRLSKEAAGRYEAPGNANWQAIQAELDKVWPEEKKKRRFFIFWWLLPAMLLGSTAWWWLQKENSGLVTEKNIPAINTIKTDNTSPVQKPLSKDNTTTVPQEKATEKTITAKIETKTIPYLLIFIFPKIKTL